jgi:vancomycin permeability regulator SanA
MQRLLIKKYFLLMPAAALGIFFAGTAWLVLAGLVDQVGQADIGLVLGSKVERDGKPSARLQARLEKTVELYRAGYFPEVIASGGLGKEGYDEAVLMRDYLVAHGIPTERVNVDSAGITTYASAQVAGEIARKRNLKSVLVVSRCFHLPRSRLALKRVGIPTVYSAHARLFEARDIYSAPRECAGYLRYWCKRYPGGNDK